MIKRDGRRKEKKDPSKEFIDRICEFYADSYDDRVEDSGHCDRVPLRKCYRCYKGVTRRCV